MYGPFVYRTHWLVNMRSTTLVGLQDGVIQMLTVSLCFYLEFALLLCLSLLSIRLYLWTGVVIINTLHFLSLSLLFFFVVFLVLSSLPSFSFSSCFGPHFLSCRQIPYLLCFLAILILLLFILFLLLFCSLIPVFSSAGSVLGFSPLCFVFFSPVCFYLCSLTSQNVSLEWILWNLYDQTPREKRKFLQTYNDGYSYVSVKTKNN